MVGNTGIWGNTIWGINRFTARTRMACLTVSRMRRVMSRERERSHAHGAAYPTRQGKSNPNAKKQKSKTSHR